MDNIFNILTDNPVIAAVKDESQLDLAAKSDCGAVFLLFGSILNIASLVEKVKESGKLAFVHIDLVEGLSGKEVAVTAIKELANPDGIISTRPALLRHAKTLGLKTVHRFFVVDSLSVRNILPQSRAVKPDFIEIMPGLLPRVIAEITQATETPVIAGGLISEKEHIISALSAGAAAVSTSRPELWEA